MLLAGSGIGTTVQLSTSTFAGPADAVTDFRNCGQMHRTFKNGVDKSRAAAHRQERTGHKRPVVRPAVYRASNESDRDRDGTACEVVDR